MKTKFLVFAVLGIMTLLFSCSKEDDSDMIALEERIFNAYLENNNITTEPTESGLYFLSDEEGTGLSPLTGNWVVIKYDLYLIDGNNLIFTTDKDKAIKNNIHDSRVIYGTSKIQIGENLQGLDEGLLMMKEGGKASLLFRSDLGYGKEGAAVIGPYKSLRINIELIEVITDPIQHEKEKMNEYFMDNNLSFSDTIESGLIYFQMEEGTGDSARMDYDVSVNVKGYFLDGRVFLDEKVFMFKVGNYNYVVTEGLSEGVSYMKEGGKAKLVVPYNLGYGVNGKSYYDGKAKVPIPPYTTLVYDVELLSVRQ